MNLYVIHCHTYSMTCSRRVIYHFKVATMYKGPKGHFIKTVTLVSMEHDIFMDPQCYPSQSILPTNVQVLDTIRPIPAKHGSQDFLPVVTFYF